MTVKTNEQLFQERWQRVLDAVALRTPDRVPVAPLGDAFAARVTGVKVADFCTKPELAYPTMIDAFTRLGEIDGIQHASYNVHALSTIWLSRVKIPGRDLPADDLWQVEEMELMEQADYERIQEEGWNAWFGRFLHEKIPGAFEGFYQGFVPTLPAAFAAWEAQGIPVLSPVIFTIPFELFCGGRSMREFMLDLHRIPDRIQAAMDVAMPEIIEGARQAIRGLGIKGCWVGGWRSASEFLSPRLWERFVFPYFLQLVEAVVEEGIVCVLHFDSNWTRDLARLREFPKAKCVLSLDGASDIFKAKEVLGDHMCLMGDVSPRMLTIGTPDEVATYSRRLIDELGPSGFILAQGCDIPPDAKPENVRAMIEAVRA